VAQRLAGAGSTLPSKHTLEMILPCNVECMHSSEAASNSITNITTLNVSRTYRDRRSGNRQQFFERTVDERETNCLSGDLRVLKGNTETNLIKTGSKHVNCA
jgi:hypothetical protein